MVEKLVKEAHERGEEPDHVAITKLAEKMLALQGGMPGGMPAMAAPTKAAAPAKKQANAGAAAQRVNAAAG